MPSNSDSSGNQKLNSLPLKEGEDFTLDPVTGYMVLTATYLLKRGYCCRNKCRNCPYTPKHYGPAKPSR